MDNWEAFWRTDGWELKGTNVPVKDRRYGLVLGDIVFSDRRVVGRYILWCMEKYRQGVPVEQFAHESKRKKKIRGYMGYVSVRCIRSPCQQMGPGSATRQTNTVDCN